MFISLSWKFINFFLVDLFNCIFIILFIAFIAILALAVTFDANNYKPQIIEQVEKATGRTFTIDGDINLSVFPWVGLKVESASLGNEKGFKAQQFAAIKQLDVKVNVIATIAAMSARCAFIGPPS